MSSWIERVMFFSGRGLVEHVHGEINERFRPGELGVCRGTICQNSGSVLGSLRRTILLSRGVRKSHGCQGIH